jgi:glutamate transport system substrate-binding protein
MDALDDEGEQMRLTRIATLVAVSALALSGVVACGSSGDTTATPSPTAKTFEAGSTMDRLSKAQKITIGTKFDQPLFGLKGLDGKPTGFDVEIGKIIAGELGIPADKIEWVESPSKVREDYIEQGKVDVVVATYTINDARKQRVAFAGPYYVAGQDILVRANDTSITGPDSFKDGTKKVCSVTGSTPAANIEKYVKDKASQIVLFDVYSKCVDALKANQVDAVTTDNVILLGYAAQQPTAVKVIGKPFTQEPYGIGVKKDDTKFREFINTTLEKIYADGRYAKAWKDTVGSVAPAPTGPAVNRY